MVVVGRLVYLISVETLMFVSAWVNLEKIESCCLCHCHNFPLSLVCLVWEPSCHFAQLYLHSGYPRHWLYCYVSVNCVYVVIQMPCSQNLHTLWHANPCRVCDRVSLTSLMFALLTGCIWNHTSTTYLSQVYCALLLTPRYYCINYENMENTSCTI